ncbi:MAG TPA: amidohydrolase family protein, partial [Woeseiaceae bacterium]
MRNVLVFLIAGVFSACGRAGDAEIGHATADLVLINGNIVTVDPAQPRVDVLAVIGDRIVASGTADEIAPWIGDSTAFIDLGGMTAIPGLIEGHGHYTSFGGSLLMLDFRHAKSFAEIVAMVAASAKTTPAGDWIIGRGWHQDKWETKESVLVEGLPLHDSLSAVTPDHPVMLIHTSGHAVFVNQKAMTLVELTDDTAAPEGGEIVRDINGR